MSPPSTTDRHSDNGDQEATERSALLSSPPATAAVSVDTRFDGGSSGLQNGHAKPSTPSTDIHGPEGKGPISNIRIIVCILALGSLIFLQATNISMLTTTSSNIAADLDAYDRTSWFTSAYLIAMASFGILNGKLASIFSPRICIFVCSLILALGALLSGLAQSFETFVAARAISGVGASGIFTISIIITLELTGMKRRGVALGLLNSGYTIGIAMGAVVAGALLHPLGWRALFWLQAPIAVLGGLSLFLAIPPDLIADSKQTSSSSPDLQKRSAIARLASLDYLGAVTLTAALVLFLSAVAASSSIPVLPIILSLLVLLTFILNETYLATDPIIPIPLLKSRGLLLTCLGTVGFMMARWGVLFYTPAYATAVRGWGDAASGSLLVPTNAGFAAGGLAVGWVHIRRPGSFYLATLAVYALFPATLAALALLATASSSAPLLVVLLACNGAATGAALNYALAHVLHLTPKSTHYVASSLVATFRGLAGSFGSAVGGGLFARSLARSLEARFEDEGLYGREGLVRKLVGSPKMVGELHGVEKAVAVGGYEDAVRTLFAAGTGLAVLMVLVQAGTGWKGAEEDEAGKVEEEERRVLINGRGDQTGDEA